MFSRLLTDRQNQILDEIAKLLIETTKGVIGHGWPHLIKTGEFAYAILLGETREWDSNKRQQLLFSAYLCGLIHDIRWWDSAERRARKLNIKPVEGMISAESLLIRLKTDGNITPEEHLDCLGAIQQHGQLPEAGRDYPLLLKALRGGDRVSRFGFDGLMSLIELNKFYADSGNDMPFYRDGEPIIWKADTDRALIKNRPIGWDSFQYGLVKNEDIKSCIGDIRACLSWELIVETETEQRLMNLGRVNRVFLELFQENSDLRDYIFWIDSLNTSVHQHGAPDSNEYWNWEKCSLHKFGSLPSGDIDSYLFGAIGWASCEDSAIKQYFQRP